MKKLTGKKLTICLAACAMMLVLHSCGSHSYSVSFKYHNLCPQEIRVDFFSDISQTMVFSSVTIPSDGIGDISYSVSESLLPLEYIKAVSICFQDGRSISYSNPDDKSSMNLMYVPNYSKTGSHAYMIDIGEDYHNAAE